MVTIFAKAHRRFGINFRLLTLFLMCLNTSTWVDSRGSKLPKLTKLLRKRCLENSKFTRDNDPCPGKTKCPVTFEKMTCFRETCPGEDTQATCPILFFYTNTSITRHCDSTGKWNIKFASIVKTCTKLPNDEAKRVANELEKSFQEQKSGLDKKKVYVIFSWISLSFMVLSLLILFYFMDRKNARFNLHKNLICAFLFRVVTFFVDHYGNLGKTMCNVFWVLNRFFAVSEVTWMLNEALFLLKLLFRTFDAKSYFWCFFAFGWGFPAILIFAVYIPLMLMVLDEDKKNKCWTKQKDSFWMFVLYGPMTLMLLINFGTLIYVIRVLLQKFRTSTSSELLILKKGIKAALILMPLLGVIYLMILYIPSNPPEWYKYLIRILYPMQGTLACLFYVVFNGEVRQAIRSKWNRWYTKSEFVDTKREKIDTTETRIKRSQDCLSNDRDLDLKTHRLLLTKYVNGEENYDMSYGTVSDNISTTTTPLSVGNDQTKLLLLKTSEKPIDTPESLNGMDTLASTR